MSHMNPQKRISIAARLLLASLMVLFPVVAAHAAAPGITGPTFNLVASTAFLNQPDGSSVYSWGYGCNGTPTGFQLALSFYLKEHRANCRMDPGY